MATRFDKLASRYRAAGHLTPTALLHILSEVGIKLTTAAPVPDGGRVQARWAGMRRVVGGAGMSVAGSRNGERSAGSGIGRPPTGRTWATAGSEKASPSGRRSELMRTV